MLLAIDTATPVASISLYRDRVLGELTWYAGQDHTRELLPQTERLLSLVGSTTSELSAIGVGLGPGSFNGLRVGIATAKAMSLSLGIPIVGIESPRALAYQFRLTFRPIRPLANAGLGEVATALYQASDQLFATIEEPHLSSLEAALNASPSDTLFCGELRPEWREAIVARFGEDGALPRPAEEPRRAGYLAELAWHQVQAGILSDVATLQPLYLRRPAISGRAGTIGSAR
ncbi:MAG: tRNA (adenosine(37)-N6)-threonylcarbamoyltransferase complex dimerization subunit type 1 TsaB [Chloroflexota bacterium]